MSSQLEGKVRVITGTGGSIGRAPTLASAREGAFVLVDCDCHVSPKDTILGFAIAVSAGIAASAIKLVARTTNRAGGGPAATGRRADSPDRDPGHHLIDNSNERRAA